MRASGGIIVYIQYTYVNDKSLFFKSEDDMLWLRLGGSIFFLDTDLCIMLYRKVTVDLIYRYNMYLKDVKLSFFNT